MVPSSETLSEMTSSRSVKSCDRIDSTHRSISGRPFRTARPIERAGEFALTAANLTSMRRQAARNSNWIFPVTVSNPTPLAGTRVLVTGASGLIGSHVLRLLGPESDVVAVSRVARPDADGVRWLVTDLAEPGATADLVASVQPEVVIHLAGEVRGDRSLGTVLPTLRANLVASVELLEAATRLGCRRIVLSGSLLEEPPGGAEPVPPSPYGASRWAATGYARMFHALFDAPVVILRPSFAYGPGQERDQADSLRDHEPARGRKPSAYHRRAPARLPLRRGRRASLHRCRLGTGRRGPHDRHR